MKTLFISLRMLIVLTILTGVAYPLLMTGIAQIFFPEQANGSLVMHDGVAIGSQLLGQKFQSERYFWSRPSAVNYNPLPSGGTNLGSTSKALKDSVIARADHYGKNALDLPPDLLLASGSGLDPDISPAAALLQIERVLAARQGTPDDRGMIEELVKAHTEPPQFGLLGEPRVNVLALNLALDSLLK